ncbi:TetR/AcrR family transcriptional regulator [Paucisalibacillus globulus]|uniref:TetR/AcrR family transcriptional regulator n=1 Tax=Paucisalibacillus globulus TaxID=351095 RepID=UPI00047C7CF2|nr:TetR/AcrR family transcriptional regulator [Paucisalibacillus globulus]
MRVVKKPEERRNEILDAVDELFSQKGFDGTTTTDILDKVGIARGTLYYYFKSKEDLMDALIERYSNQLLGGANRIAADKDIPIIERIVRVVLSLNLSGGSSEEIMDHIHKPQNALMHQKIQKMIINEVTPIMAEIIQEGVEQGVFHTPYPYECMEMLITYTNTIFDDNLVEMTNEERIRRMEAFIFNTERILGAESGSLMEVIQIFGNEE